MDRRDADWSGGREVLKLDVLCIIVMTTGRASTIGTRISEIKTLEGCRRIYSVRNITHLRDKQLLYILKIEEQLSQNLWIISIVV